MKSVRVVTGLTVEEVIVPHYEQVVHLFERPLVRFTDSHEIGVLPYSKRDVDITITPIKRWVEGRVDCRLSDFVQTFEEGYIAINPELDPILSRYFSVLGDEIAQYKQQCAEYCYKLDQITEEKNTLQKSLQELKATIESASLWQRIKWVFTGVKNSWSRKNER